MVSVGKLKAGQARYYVDQAQSHPSPAHAVASGAEDYHVGGTEAAGRWQGRGAIALGLTDTVEAEALHRVLAGQDPRTGTELRRSGSVAGFDVTFSAPKSASVLFGSVMKRCRRRFVTHTSVPSRAPSRTPRP